ncbi:MAG: anaerobic sulfatase maturase [Anaerolineae bacterium]
MTANAPPRIHVLAKPTGAACNLACAYCFFLDKELLYPDSRFRMSDEVLEAYIRQLVDAHRTQQVTVAWQGGEPTLMGLDFYRRAIELQKKHARPGMTFENTMQTNGTLLDDEWCEFFKEHNYLIGISIDGPRHLHDTYRLDKGGGPTFDRVMRGLRLLQKHGVEYNILVAVNRTNADYPLEVYRFLRDEARTTWIQFIPVVERIDDEGHTIYQKGTRLSRRSVQPEQLGRFLIQIFDEWVRHDVGRMFVQTFEAAARNWLRMPSSGMCVFEPTCGLGLALEHNGDLYSCDHFVEPDYLLGNIMDTPMAELVASDRQRQFGLAKRDSLPRACRECEVRFACHGECPKNRFSEAPRSPQGGVGLTTLDGEPGLNYLCAGWKAFFHRVDEPLQMLAALMRMGRPASEITAIMAGKEDEWAKTLAQARARKRFDDPCPCGSGLTFGACHGWARPDGGRKGQGAGARRPRPPVREDMHIQS